MATQITGITIGGVSVALGDVEYNVFVTHGRSNITDGASSSTAAITLIGKDDTMPSVAMAQMLNIKAHGVDRFTGRITDLNIEHIKNTNLSRFNIQAIGKVSRLGTKTIGGNDFPKENAHARALSIMQLSGEDYIVEGGYEIELKAKTANDQPILDIINQLASDVGAAVVDRPDGKILVQFYDARGANEYFEKWQDQGNQKWSEQTLRWIDKQAISPTAGIPVNLNANTVIYEPIWRINSGSIINRVNLGYDNGAVYTVEDTGSQADFGLRALGLNTEIHDLTSATLRAGQILNRQSQPRWAMGSVEVYMDRITDTTQRSKLMALTCGNRVQVNGLPKPAPYTNWVGVVEGWSESFVGNGNNGGTHRLVLALSDPFASYAGMTWNQLLLQKWNTINTSVIWANAITPENLVP